MGSQRDSEIVNEPLNESVYFWQRRLVYLGRPQLNLSKTKKKTLSEALMALRTNTLVIESCSADLISYRRSLSAMYIMSSSIRCSFDTVLWRKFSAFAVSKSVLSTSLLLQLKFIKFY
uniref:Uncharacterized protein n=1 Tax=Parascaris univalens TaxID=6257 RepID=A0A915BTC5_PARUN